MTQKESLDSGAADASQGENNWTPEEEKEWEQGYINGTQATLHSRDALLDPMPSGTDDTMPPPAEDPEPERSLSRPGGPAPPPAKKEVKFREKPPAHTSRAKAARDTRPDLKPFPYGTMDDENKAA